MLSETSVVGSLNQHKFSPYADREIFCYTIYMGKVGDDVSIWDLLNPNMPRSERIEMERRYAICQECPFFMKGSKRCSKCGCFMKLKTSLEQAKCPVHKW